MRVKSWRNVTRATFLSRKCIRMCVAGVLVGLIVWRIDSAAVLGMIVSISSHVVFALMALSLIDRIVVAYKWNLLLRARGVILSLWEAIKLCFVGNLVGSFTPGGIGGDAYRVAALSSLQRNHDVLATIVLERLFGLCVLGTFVLCTAPWAGQYLNDVAGKMMWAVIGATGVVVFGMAVSLRQSFSLRCTSVLSKYKKSKIVRSINEFYQVYGESRKHTGALLMFAIVGVLQIVFQVFIAFASARALGIEVTFLFLVTVMPLALAVSRLPISIQGIGVLEGLMAYFLSSGGFSAEAGVSIVLLMRAVGFVAGVLPSLTIIWLSPIPPPIENEHNGRGRQLALKAAATQTVRR